MTRKEKVLFTINVGKVAPIMHSIVRLSFAGQLSNINKIISYGLHVFTFQKVPQQNYVGVHTEIYRTTAESGPPHAMPRDTNMYQNTS